MLQDITGLGGAVSAGGGVVGGDAAGGVEAPGRSTLPPAPPPGGEFSTEAVLSAGVRVTLAPVKFADPGAVVIVPDFK